MRRSRSSKRRTGLLRSPGSSRPACAGFAGRPPPAGARRRPGRSAARAAARLPRLRRARDARRAVLRSRPRVWPGRGASVTEPGGRARKRSATRPGARTGRRAGDSGTKAAILAAARAQFAAHGYDGATIRAIAAAAGVDPALVHHFYGSKESLFAAVMQLPVVPGETARARRSRPASADPAESLGEHLVRTVLQAWEVHRDPGRLRRADPLGQHQRTRRRRCSASSSPRRIASPLVRGGPARRRG